VSRRFFVDIVPYPPSLRTRGARPLKPKGQAAFAFSFMPLRANVYIGGFNFYYGSLKGTKYKWLDFSKLCQLLLPTNTIGHIRYFPLQLSPERAILSRANVSKPTFEHYELFLTSPLSD
jgi:hypothetical protein